MRTMKAIVTGMSAATLAMIMACGIGTTADAAGTAAFDASKQTMTASGEGVEVMVSFDAIKVVKNEATWNAKAKWDVYDGTEATVDLSTLKVTKDMYVAVKDNTSELPNVYHISPDTTKLAGKYEVAEKASKLTFTDNKAALDAKAVLEYRTEKASTWSKYTASSFPMDMYEQQGATLYFRKQAAKMTATAEEETPEGQEYVMNEVAGYFASTEVKVKVTKMANAPTATIDYDKGTFKMKAGTEYRLIDSTGAFVVPTGIDDAVEGTFAPAPTDFLVSIDVSKNGVFEIRTAADKKVASKITAYAYKGVATPKASEVINGAVVGDEENPGTLTKKGLNLIYGEDKKGNAQVTFNSTNTTVSYLVYTEDPAANAKAKPIATLKKAEEKGYKDVVVPSSKLKNGTTLYIMTASDKKAEVFRSAPLKTVKIAYPGADDEEEEEA